MSKPAIFDFLVEPDARTITVQRSFHASLDHVWAAWTEADILCRWWAPKPYQCVIKSLDFREGGRWLYCMQGPEGDRHWCFFDYEVVRPKTFYSGADAFCDEQGVANETKPRVKWENRFSEADGVTTVHITCHFASSEHVEQLVQMGFREGFTACMEQLDELLATAPTNDR